MERLGRWLKISKRKLAGFMAVVLVISTIGIPVPVMGSEVWPQKSTAPYYCLDGGKGWKASDRYEIYQYDTLPSVLTETQAKRLFWAYPSNWNALKEAASRYDPELYSAIASTGSSANVVKRIKDDPGTKFAWVADNPEIENRAITALEKVAAENTIGGKEVPEPIRGATSEETAASFFVPAMCEGPGALDTEFKLSSEFIRDIAKIEAQSVWDNGSTGGNIGWLDASQDKNIAKAVMGEELYEITWSDDSIKIHNNGSAVANENLVGSSMSEEEKYNKTTVRYKITMRENSGWFTEGNWNENYLREWMDFKACINAPGHQRLYKADIRIVPSDMVFYLVISQGPTGETLPAPEYGITSSDVSFQIYRHEEMFESNYNVKLKKVDDETGKPLKGSQFYLYERFQDWSALAEDESDGGLVEENLSFTPWDGFQIFAEGLTNENGEISHTDTRSYFYSKTYCDGHGVPEWSNIQDEEAEENEADKEGNESGGNEDGSNAETDEPEEAKDQNRKAAKEWLALYESCKEAEQNSGGAHFHWLSDEELYGFMEGVAESGDPGDFVSVAGADAERAFEASGCKADCENTYKNFIELKFTYTWKEIQARNGYILHGIHKEDEPIGLVTTVSSEAGAKAFAGEGNSGDIVENIWYSGNSKAREDAWKYQTRKNQSQSEDNNKNLLNHVLNYKETSPDTNRISVNRWFESMEPGMVASRSDAATLNTTATMSNTTATASNIDGSDSVKKESGIFAWLYSKGRSVALEDETWEEIESGETLESYFVSATDDGIRHLNTGKSDNLSYAGEGEDNQKYWIVRDHRTEGEIHINKRDMNLYKGEADDYSSYGDTQGDTDLEGAVYGLFAAEDIVHPDADILTDGKLTNTGVVYKKNDLVAVATTDEDGNADYFAYTVAPGMTFDYETEQIKKREDIDWRGPENRYKQNLEKSGNWWIGRPLILGNYYIKELSRSEGYELSINGSSKEWTNYGSSFETPPFIVEANGTAVLSMPELSASMEGESERGNGYDQLTFSVTSSGTTDAILGTSGYEIIASGFPKDTKFYWVDSGEMEVTGPHVTGTEERIVKDDNGDIVWKTAESDTSHVKYEPEYGADGTMTGQIPVSRIEPQIQKIEQIPQVKKTYLEKIELDLSDSRWNEMILENNLVDSSSELFCFIKAELERVLNQNGYDIPVTAAGKQSQTYEPVFSMGVIKGQVDTYGMTVEPGALASKTVYGAALQDIVVEDVDENTTALQLLNAVLVWYQENPQWNFGGIHSIESSEGQYTVTVYAGISLSGSRSFFTMSKDHGCLEPDSVYMVLENPATLRWEYQEYKKSGPYQYQIDKQYYLGSGDSKRYYLDATLAPVVMIDRNGERQVLEHQVMVYHAAGEEIVDYLNGDSKNGYRVPLTETVDKIEITTEMEYTEQDILLEDVKYDKNTGLYRIFVETDGEDSFGTVFSDELQSLTLSFMAKLPTNKTVLSEADIKYLGSANVYGYKAGETIGYAEYLMRFADAALSVNTGGDVNLADTYIVPMRLVYRGQHKSQEDGNTTVNPVQMLERPIVQKVKVKKEIEGEEAIGNFRFKVYLKSNLERLYCREDGTITWLDRNGTVVDIKNYQAAYPELVQKLYTEETERNVLEKVKRTVIHSDGTTTKTDTYNYEKFFAAINVANTDKWHNAGHIWNTSLKPFVKGLFSGIENTVNSSPEAKENAKRSDAVRQFAVDWYLEDEVKILTVDTGQKGELQSKDGPISYADQIYDKALYEAILKAEDYLAPFFLYDLDSVYEIMWDSESDGGIDDDMATLSANMLSSRVQQACGVSKYLPYGEYVIVEQQPYNPEWNDFQNRHYEIDAPKEVSLPQYFDKNGELINPEEVPWSITEPEKESEMTGYASIILKNKRYKAKLRIEKLDVETGEPILHDESIFALYRAERNEDRNGDGAVKRYKEDTIISGSKVFLEAMGAKNISSFARVGTSYNLGVGMLYTGMVSAGTPICSEEDCVVFNDKEGEQTGTFLGLTTVNDLSQKEMLQTTGYFETPESVDAGVYVLAELKAPSGYVRSKPIAVEVYSDGVTYYSNGESGHTAAVSYGAYLEADGTLGEKKTETIRIYVNDTATSLEVSKVKTTDSYRGMKISGRVEGTVTQLKSIYGLENLQLAYNSAGTYLGFGWKKGTLEYLQNRKNAGERIQLVYENGVFQGYAYVTRDLETSDDENPYIVGAQLALFEAIKIRRNGDSEDAAFEGVKIVRDKNSNVKSIYVKEGFAGERTEFLKTDQETWECKTVQREDTPVLFYDLGNLQVLETDAEGTLYGFDENGQKIQVMFDTESIFAVRNGQVMFEITGGDFKEVVYDDRAKAFTKLGRNTKIYHLDQDLCRDAQVDGYTGLAYVEGAETANSSQTENDLYVWPVVELKDEDGNVFAREKILTGRPGEKNSGTDQAYITGTMQGESGVFEKSLNPILDGKGLVKYYPENDYSYKKGDAIYDRDGEYLGYRYEDLLDEYNYASYRITEDPVLYSTEPLMHREGESWIIPNVWISGEVSPQDPTSQETTNGQADLLRRVIPGTYVMEELNVPEGYVRSLPVAVQVKETVDVQRVSMTDEKTKVEIAKVDGTDQYRKRVSSNLPEEKELYATEGTSGYTGKMVENAELALFKAKRVYTSDYASYPKGYYLVKAERTPACWYTESNEGNKWTFVEARWITNNQPKYFEGIPAGDYILEELRVPDGYLPATQEITVRETEKLQSFVIMEDHTKLEIFKYEEEDGKKQFLKWPAKAELTLYPAVLDSSGQAVMENGSYIYDETNIAASWTTGDLEQYKAIAETFESMFRQYSNSFKQFAWKVERNGKWSYGYAQLEENRCTENNEVITQIWKLEDGSRLRVTVTKNEAMAHVSSDALPEFAVEYQFQYQTGFNKSMPELVSYDFLNGIHRLDRIPTGYYVLVETKVPDGYQKMEPQLILMEETEEIQRYYVENEKEKAEDKKGTLTIQKCDSHDNSETLSGAWFEVKNLQSGAVYRTVTGNDGKAVIEGLAVTGVYENGKAGPCIYEVREILSPDGYQLESTVWKFRFQENEDQKDLCHILNVENKKTEIIISKKDFHTDHFVQGAKLAIYEAKLKDGKYIADGEAIETWISGPDPHCVTGKLSCGRTYILVEEYAPDGYIAEEPIRFTVSADGKRITDITKDMVQIQVQYQGDLNQIASIVVTGRSAIEVENTLCAKKKCLLTVPGTGKSISWKEIAIGGKTIADSYKSEILTTEEQLRFSDGSKVMLQKETFRVEDGSRTVYESSGRYPIGTEYALFNSNGIRIDKWNVTTDSYVHKIVNERNQEGKLRLEGDKLYLTETVVFSNGDRVKTNRISMNLSSDGSASAVEILNKETEVRIRKTDLTTGKEIPGASLAIKDLNGVILDEWISEEEDHVIKGVLVAGEPYILTERMAADGYAYAEEIVFTIHESGTIEKVVMEDRPTCVEIRKTDMTTGEDLPGAKLTLQDEEGTIIAQWISGETPYLISGHLIAGATYTLTEEIAPEGYLIAEKVIFTVSKDGRIDRVVMEDERKKPEKEPEREPESSEEPEKPEAVELPENSTAPERSAKVSKKGCVTAVYGAKMKKSGQTRLIRPEGLESLVIPNTGEGPLADIAFLGIIISMTGLCWIYWGRRKNKDEQSKKASSNAANI